MAINTVINTNVRALNSHRNLGLVGNQQAKANQRLSSGKKINSAADDAAGLAITEKMRAQIKGLDMASKNAEDATSLIQTAEGSLTEVSNMVNRMRELTVQAGNDTNTAEDKQKIAKEMMQLYAEIDAISERTEFNAKKLTNGDFETKTLHFQIGANKGQKLELNIGDMAASKLDTYFGGSMKQALSKLANGVTNASNNTSVVSYQYSADGTVNGSQHGTIKSYYSDITGASFSNFLTSIDAALSKVSDQRASLGANQNRLEYTIKNLNVASENLSAAKSRIEDTDMAKEMMNLTSANVLQQAATSMLAQANQAPQQITQLLG